MVAVIEGIAESQTWIRAANFPGEIKGEGQHITAFQPSLKTTVLFQL